MNSKYVSFMAMLILSALFISCLSEGEDPNKDLNNELKVIDAYLTTSGASADDIVYDNNSRIRFYFLGYGNGIVPREGQKVNYSVTGSILTSIGPSAPFINTSKLEDIKDITPGGLKFALSNMLEGSAALVYVPSRYAYGAKGEPTLGIPANAIIEYRITLDEVERTSTQQTRFEQDTAAFKDFFILKSIEDVVEHESGLFYTVDVSASGQSPKPYNPVTFEYKLSTLVSPDKVIESSTLSNVIPFGLIDGLKIGLQEMSVGETYTFYIPSGMAYGPTASGQIPINANLIFEIKLTAAGK